MYKHLEGIKNKCLHNFWLQCVRRR